MTTNWRWWLYGLALLIAASPLLLILLALGLVIKAELGWIGLAFFIAWPIAFGYVLYGDCE